MAVSLASTASKVDGPADVDILLAGQGHGGPETGDDDKRRAAIRMRTRY